MSKSVENYPTCAWRNKPLAWLRCRKGATAIEYGLIVALIAVVISVTIFMIGTDMVEMFEYIHGLLS